MKQGSLDLSTYYKKKKTLREQLENMKSSSSCSCKCGKVKELLENAEDSKIIQFMMELNDKFANIRGHILNTKPRPCLANIYNMLDQDESQRSSLSVNSNVSYLSTFQVMNFNESTAGAIFYSQYQKKPVGSHCGKNKTYCGKML